MKENFSLPKKCALNVNVSIYKHTVLKLDKSVLIVSENNYIRRPAYYISFSKHKDRTNMSSIGEIVYYDKFGCDFLNECYYLKDRKYLFQTRFEQIQEGVVHITTY